MEAESSNSLQNLRPERSNEEFEGAGTVNCVVEDSDSAVRDTLKQSRCFKKIRKKSGFKDFAGSFTSSVASFSSSSSSTCRSQTGVRVGLKRRISKVKFGDGRRSGSDVESIALPLGMSFAAVVAQVIAKKDALGERMSVDHLSMICTSAVRESLANVFGDKFDCFVSNFDKSFGSTLRTLRLINESSFDKGGCQSCHRNVESATSVVSLKKEACAGKGCGCTTAAGTNYCYSEASLHNIASRDQLHDAEEAEEDVPTDSLNRQLALCGQINQEVCISQSTLDSVRDQSVLSTFEKSIMEQVRSNDLKTMELGLTMRRLKLKETQLALSSDSNHLERSKLTMGISKASFKAEKFKNQVEDMKHIELLRMCTDFLVAGLVIMSISLSYGAFVYSQERIYEATSSCMSLPMESKSWWVPNPMASVKSSLQIFWCQVQVLSRRLFGFLMIIAIGYMLVQRSATSRQSMPITFILLLLGVACGFAGKLCVDTLGGSGYHWLIYWETMCMLHFFSNVCTSTLFLILHGPITVTQQARSKAMFPYWIGRYLYYAILLLFLPLLCGLVPFASLRDWKNHFSELITKYLSTLATEA